MIQILYGKKGSGKSKQLVDMANKEILTAHGNVVFIDDDSRAMYDLRHEVRFVDITHYNIDTQEKLFGLICGIMARDYDISCIFMDGIKKIIEKDLHNTEPFFKNLSEVLKDSSIRFVMIISGDEDDIPDFIKEYII